MTVPVPLTADPTHWDHSKDCALLYLCDIEGCRICPPDHCSCGLSALREAMASGDPLAVLGVLGMGGTLEEEACLTKVDAERIRRLIRTPEVSP